VSCHAQPRATKDIDLSIKADRLNAEALYTALASFGAPLGKISVEDVLDPHNFILFGRPWIFFLLSTGSNYLLMSTGFRRQCLGKTDRGSHDPETGLIGFLSRNDLIASKLAAGRLNLPRHDAGMPAGAPASAAG
jgi:hypothetical protein